ncbi:MAG: hypothetical protein AMJ78_04550 [Omnitrophica WOR_2 bacterium SM23_29]|nr:MAG: hypothetical protein AMJ78_04550 [Omnitrophica WOR_2 bacterium SM23_29]
MNFEREKGTILIITLWILTILTVLSVGVAGRMGLELKLTGFYRDNLKALYLAKAGIERAIEIVNVEDHMIDNLSERWSNNAEEQSPLFKTINVAEIGTFTVSHHFTEDNMFYGVQDEERRININNAPKQIIERLIEYLNPEIADASEVAALIEDWRDTDTVREGGSPEYIYSSEGYPRKDDYFDAAEEVLLVKDMTKEIFDNIKEHITVYPAKPEGKLNINTASLPSLVALGLSVEIAQKLITTRAGLDGTEGTSDDIPFNQGAFNTFLNDNDATLPPESANLVAFGSYYFRIISYGETDNKKGHKTIVCIVGPHPTEPIQQVLFWNEE